MPTSTEPDFFALAVEIICFIQEGRWYNGKVNTKLAEQVADRLRWGPGTAWWPTDQRLCREWAAERLKRAAVLPRPIPTPTLPRPVLPPQLPRVVPPVTLPRPIVTPPLPRV